MIDANGDWDGICACGKKEADGITCALGATHETLEVSQERYWTANPQLRPQQPLPWEIPSIPATPPAASLPWTQNKLPWE